MLKELVIEYGDGRKENKIVLNQDASIYPQRDNITFCFCKPFKYKIEKHAYLPVAIVRLQSKTMIMPAGIECHPGTDLNDIKVIDNSPKEKPEPKPREKRTWKFDSASSNGFYIVRENMGRLYCNCMGVWRAKDRRCKHIKEVEQILINRINE
jgi:hypothetical protein